MRRWTRDWCSTVSTSCRWCPFSICSETNQTEKMFGWFSAAKSDRSLHAANIPKLVQKKPSPA